MQLEQAPHVYEARKRRVEWPDAVRLDHEVKALDEQHGEWILCRTCAEHYEKYLTERSSSRRFAHYRLLLLPQDATGPQAERSRWV